MRDIPDCLNRRYQALDELIKELSEAVPGAGAGSPAIERPSTENNQIGIKLMCDFWNILKDDPDCNLTEEVQQRMGVDTRQASGMFGPQRLNCYMAGKEQEKSNNEDRKRDVMSRIRHIYCPNESKGSSKKSCCSNKLTTPCAEKTPLSKVLCNLKEAASFDKKCNIRVGELMAAQKELTEQIQNLEAREKEGVMLLKQADCMWSCMEESYKKKVADSLETQKVLMKQLKEVETSANKWRKNLKDLEFQMTNINKCQEDIVEKINQKKNDMKVMDMEIEDFKKRIASNVKDIDTAKNSWRSKKETSDARLANIAQEMVKLQNKVNQEQKFKFDKEEEGSKYVKDAREDLQKICRVLLQKKLENEDLRAEKEALLQEIDLLKKTCDNCKEKCTNKEKMIEDEIKRLEGELAVFRVKCTRCHECTDTIDVRKFCTDCPRCIAERDCLYEEDHCSPDHTMDCVCMSVKQKFLDNVFDNMYTVLERQAKTCPGKAVADCILNCLKRSRNGKLNEETRKILQDFILSTVKKNLNLTIVGGAVKTRCEMDQETYKQLMLCLKEVTVTRPAKEDKGTAKKEPCRRWGGPSECNCPKGPKACICTKKAPPPPTDPTPCGPVQQDEAEGEMKICPPRESAACGTDCGLLGFPDQVGADVSVMRRDPCGSKTCPFSKNMRAAQCVLGPESLASPTKQHHPTPPIIPYVPITEKMGTCTCGAKETKPCRCRRDRRRQPRQRIIEEVMGRYTEVAPIDKVARVAEREFGVRNSSRTSDAGYTKHVKAEVKDNCNKGTCANLWEQTEDNLQVPSVQKDVLYNSQKQEELLKYAKQNQYGKIEQLKVAVENEIGKSTHQYIELKQTESGRLALELDEDIIELIEKKSKEDRYLFVSFKKTESGHLLIDFDTKENVVNADQRVMIRKTPSGTRLLDVHKNIVSMLKNTLSNEKPNCDLSNSIKLSSSPQRKESSEQIVTDKYSPLVDSQTKTNANQENNSKSKSSKRNKEFDIEIYKPASAKSSIISKTQSPKSSNEEQRLPSTFLMEGKIYERNPDSSSWKSVTSVIDKKKPSRKVKCKCPPGENMERDECICPPSTKCIHSHRNDIQESKECTCPIPPITYSWKPGDTIIQIQKENLECTCPKTTPDSVCCKLISETDLPLQIVKAGCECTHDSQTTNSWKSATSRSALSVDEPDFVSELKELYKKGNADVALKIRGKSGIVRKLLTVVTRTLSGTMAIYSKNMSSRGDISFDENEYPVFLSKTISGTYFVGFGQYDRTLNATLKKTASGGILLVPKSKFIQQQIRKTPGFEEFFKVKVSGVRDYPVELPAVLKTTPSENYIIVLDKEFENSYRQTVNEYIGVKGECIIDLNITSSGNYVIELDTEGERHLVKKNALLVKSSSGNIKVLVRGPEFEAMVPSVSKKSSTSSAKAFGQLVNKLPVSSREIHRENLRKSKYLDKKASSDTQLYEKRIKLEDNKRLLSEPSAVLKKTASGQYAIILNKESKKAFINNLQSYIAANSKGLVPIKRSESGEIIINLNNIDDIKGHYGSLKITSSGNIYVMVDEDVIKVMAKGSKNNDVTSRAVDTKSTHGTATIDNSVNKAVATSCNANPDDCGCDLSTCVCGELQFDTTDWFYSNSENEEQPSIFKKVLNNANHKKADKYCGIARKNTPRDKSPHIVIKPACDCRPPAKKKFGAAEQCYYLIDTVCPYHKDRYDAVSNEILEISGLCNKVEGDKMEFKANCEVPDVKKGRKVWDSLNYLPPQLPPFLRNVRYRK